MIYNSAAIDQRKCRHVDAETYDNFVEALSQIPLVRSNDVSILVHGSYAKQDLVPGWSDVDLLVLYRDLRDRREVEMILYAYAHACDLLLRPVFAQFDTVATEKNLSGFPQAALIDGLSAGFFVSGKDEIEKIEPCDTDVTQLRAEAQYRQKRLLKNWATGIRPNFRVNPSSFVIDSAKTALQFLMYHETSLWSKNRTRSGYLDSYKKSSEKYVELFDEALLVREYWYEYVKGRRMYAAQDLFFCWMMMLLDANWDSQGSRVTDAFGPMILLDP